MQWIGGHFAATALVAVGMVIGGVTFALKSRDSSLIGWIVAVAGAALAVWALKLKGLW